MRIRKGIVGKVVVVFFLLTTVPVFISIMQFMQIMSAFETEGVLMSAEYVNVENTAIYQSLREVMAPYYEQLYEELEEQREITIDKYSVKYEVPIVREEPETESDEVNDEEGDSELTDETETEEQEEVEIIIVEPTVMRRINYVPENLIIAYLIMNDGIETDTAVINQSMAWAFLDSISSIQEIDVGDNTYWIENRILTVAEITDMYFGDETEKIRFNITCEAYGEYFDVAQSKIITEDGEEILAGNYVESISNVPLYLQYDSAWANKAYGNGTMKKNGCCPTCLAMVFSYFRGESIYPDDVVAWSGNKYYVSGAGTAWSIFEPAGNQWGVSCMNIGKNHTQMRQALSNGKLIIASMGAGTFTKGGHFIVLTGITEDGKIRVNDPNDSSIKKHSQMEFEISLILRECKNMWVFG